MEKSLPNHKDFFWNLFIHLKFKLLYVCMLLLISSLGIYILHSTFLLILPGSFQVPCTNILLRDCLWTEKSLQKSCVSQLFPHPFDFHIIWTLCHTQCKIKTYTHRESKNSSHRTLFCKYEKTIFKIIFNEKY